MSISAYVGVPGSGKSYEVVKSVLLPAYMSGRRIVTNIEGIKEEAFREYVLSRKKSKIDDLGTIIRVSDDDVMQDNFFPFKTNDKTVETVCKSGDLIAIDELWRIWESEGKIPNNHRSFIAEHRHFTDDITGLCCDLVVINQSVGNLPRFLKDRIETTYRMSKHISLGLNSRYRVDVFNGIKLFKNNRVTYYQEKYDKEIFKLYSSYDSQNGTESITDKRQNIFKNKRILFLCLFLLIMLFTSIFFIYKFFSSRQSASKIVNTDQTISMSINQNLQFKSEPEPEPKLSTTWRISGALTQNGKSFVILMSNSGAIKLEPASQFMFSGLAIQGTINGEIVTKYTGGTAQ